MNSRPNTDQLLENYSADALRKYRERHNEVTDSILFNAATFVCDADRGVFVVEVRGHVVCEPRTLREVEAFCEMHNGRIMGDKYAT